MLIKKMIHGAGVCVFSISLLAYNEYSYSQEPKKDIPAEKESSQVTFVAGFTAYYANWTPVWKRYRAQIPAYSQGDFHPKAAFMYGPSLSVAIDRWQISVNFLYGDFKGSLLSFNYLPDITLQGNNYFYPARTTLGARKYDGDFLVSYQINSLFKFFFGPKYQGYQYKKNISKIYKTSTYDIQYHSGGLGAGVGCTLPIAGDLYLVVNFAGVVLVGSQWGSDDMGDRTSIAYGGNETVTLMYSIRAAHIVISAGGRLQYLYFHITPNRFYPSRHDIFYGINMSAGASF